MEKTKSGISVGAMGAVIYFCALLGGYIPLLLVCGYIFLAEKTPFLKKAAFKALVLMLFFSALCAVVNILNEFMWIFNSLFSLELEIPLNIDDAVLNAVSVVKTIVFSILGFKALSTKDVPIKTIDNSICCEKDLQSDESKQNK